MMNVVTNRSRVRQTETGRGAHIKYKPTDHVVHSCSLTYIHISAICRESDIRLGRSSVMK